MKIFLSADIEGTAGIAHWNEADRNHADYREFRALMTAEVVAACEGARAAGAEQVVIKDAHDSGRNLILDLLPDYARVIRGWSGHPDGMMFGLADSFTAALYIGYHSKAGTETNPLAHTTTTRISRLLLNGEVASEFTLNALCAARHGVPSAFLAGDAGICADARAMIPGIGTVETLEGAGPAANSLAPTRARALIRQGVEAALSRDLSTLMPQAAETYEIIVEFCNPGDAYRASWYPGARSHGARAVALAATQFFDIQRALRFILV
ncbi:M55 family metallopeptidase [Mesorhizobium sp. VK25A]|uniref:M55 family metallopeptidase n=1 Tax=Mesorhizobium vachelliae TaxID=3072309 RepID=A0ABU5A8C8_9HYPH|nr:MULTISPECIES: M55 family metallopeptidase [unclassified Mesorhizobium]MDX8532857.1 M55 family metallopeptidase [Mesorhizobium sp. VK25D]MDX8544637.1 M55 family metallopeptidase [Mesorhizobium sp. VK25A]